MILPRIPYGKLSAYVSRMDSPGGGLESPTADSQKTMMCHETQLAQKVLSKF